MSYAPIDRRALSAWRFRSSATTHPGAVRVHNEDSYVNRPDLGLWAVADGAGGHQAGDVASRIIADALNAVSTGFDGAGLLVEVRHCLARAHYALRIEAARRGPDAMLVSTIVVLLVRDDYYACLWAGDSRAYLLRGERFRQLTRDHSLVQELFDAGAISAAEILHHPSANIITRAIGAEGLELDKVTDRLFSGDRFLLCSDGLFKTLPERELARVLGAEADLAAERLLRAALEQHADDNVTVVAVEASGAPDWGDVAGGIESSAEDEEVTRHHGGLG
jgi:protein phosphatase/serine/threonine-protein phosphatase Stp1